MQISLLPVYSKLADAAEVEATFGRPLPVDLSQHQLETYRALTNDNIDVVINTAMTGDGKSLAGQLPLLSDKRNILALFPTNELVQDQFGSSQNALPAWGIKADRVGVVTGAALDELHDAAETLSRPEVLLREMEQRKLLLSNPDIFHAIFQFHYQQLGRAATLIAGSMGLRFDQYTFDEFHIFDQAQVIAVLSGLLFLYEQAVRPPKTLFLSATPDPRLLDPLQRTGFGPRLKLIVPQDVGWYAHGPDPGAGWRQILRGCALSFAAETAEEWAAHGIADTLIPWFERHGRGAKAAIIVNSVASAHRLVGRLRAALPPDLRVEPNTGLTGRSLRKRSYDADVLVGTSTVDVGVDFRINLLVFEADSAGVFMQRLGRLGRHADYTDASGQTHPFHEFAAVALVRPFILERLSLSGNGQPPRLQDGATLQRDQLAEVIGNPEVYPPPTDFRHYARLWGRFQPAKIIATLSDKRSKMTFTTVNERLTQRYKTLTGANMYKALKDWRGYQQSDEELLVDEALAFRGSSGFQCGIFKPDEGAALDYDLFWLLANARLELLSRAAFQQAATQLGQPLRPPRLKRLVFCFRWLGMREERELLLIRLTPLASAWTAERHHTAQVLPGFTLECAGQPSVNSLNDTLPQHKCVALIIPGYEPLEAKRKLRLAPQAPLLPYRTHDDHSGGSIAFGRWALLLDSRLRYQKATTGDTPLFL